MRGFLDFAAATSLLVLFNNIPRVHSFLVQRAKTFTTQINLYSTIEEAIAEAQRVCALNPDSQECKVAWDIVEELEAADSHRESADLQQSPQSPLQTSPDLVALVNSFEILANKIDTKMDQLKATTDKLQELGANDSSVVELGARAQEMRQILDYVRKGLRNQV